MPAGKGKGHKESSTTCSACNTTKTSDLKVERFEQSHAATRPSASDPCHRYFSDITPVPETRPAFAREHNQVTDGINAVSVANHEINGPSSPADNPKRRIVHLVREVPSLSPFWFTSVQTRFKHRSRVCMKGRSSLVRERVEEAPKWCNTG